MDSFDRFLGHLDPIKSSSNLDICLEAAQRIMIDDVDDSDKDISLYDSSGDEKELTVVEIMHHSGDLERLFKAAGQSTSTSIIKDKDTDIPTAPRKGRRRPATSSNSPKISSTRKESSLPQRPSSCTSLKSSPPSAQRKNMGRNSRHTDEHPEVRPRQSRPKVSLSQSQHDPMRTSLNGPQKDDLSKTEHEHKARRIRRDELYSLQRAGNRKSKSMTEPTSFSTTG